MPLSISSSFTSTKPLYYEGFTSSAKNIANPSTTTSSFAPVKARQFEDHKEELTFEEFCLENPKITHWSRTLSNLIPSNHLFGSTALIAGGHDNFDKLEEINKQTHEAYLIQYLDQELINPDFLGAPLYAHNRVKAGASRLWSNSNADMRHFGLNDFNAMISTTSIQHPSTTMGDVSNPYENNFRVINIGGKERIVSKMPDFLYTKKNWHATYIRSASIPFRLNTGFILPLIKRQMVHWNHVIRCSLPENEGDFDGDDNNDENIQENDGLDEKSVENIRENENNNEEEEKTKVQSKIDPSHAKLRIKVQAGTVTASTEVITNNLTQRQKKIASTTEAGQSSSEHDQNTPSAKKIKTAPAGFSPTLSQAAAKEAEEAQAAAKELQNSQELAPKTLTNPAFNPNKRKATTMTKISESVGTKKFGHYEMPKELENLLLTPWHYDMIRFDLQSTTSVQNLFNLQVENTIFITLPAAINKYIESYHATPHSSQEGDKNIEKKLQKAHEDVQNFIKKYKLSNIAKNELYEAASEAQITNKLPWVLDNDSQSITYAVTLHFSKQRWSKEVKLKKKVENLDSRRELDAFIGYIKALPPLDDKGYPNGSFLIPQGDREDWSQNAYTRTHPLELLAAVVGPIEQSTQYPGHEHLYV